MYRNCSSHTISRIVKHTLIRLIYILFKNLTETTINPVYYRENNYAPQYELTPSRQHEIITEISFDHFHHESVYTMQYTASA